MKPKFRDYFIDIAERTAQLSTAQRLKVGAVLVKDRGDTFNIVAFGYNGTPPGWSNICEDENGNTKPEVRHAEENILYKIAKSSESSDGCYLFITHLPCPMCAKLLHGAGIKAVFYRYLYRDHSALNTFKNEIHFEQI